MLRLSIALITLLFLCLPLQDCMAKDDSPSEAFFKFKQVFEKAESLDELKPFLAKAPLEKMPEVTGEEAKAALEMMKLMGGTNFKVEKEEIDGDSATLMVKGDPPKEDLFEPLKKGLAKAFNAPEPEEQAPEPVIGIVKMVREDGAWKVLSESYKSGGNVSMPDKESVAWAAGAVDETIPDKPAAGEISGKPFQVGGAKISEFGTSTCKLELFENKDGMQGRMITIRMEDPADKLEDSKLDVNPKSGSYSPPSITISGGDADMKSFDNWSGYGMHLEFGKYKDWQIPGKVSLKVPGSDKIVLLGTFLAKRNYDDAFSRGLYSLWRDLKVSGTGKADVNMQLLEDGSLSDVVVKSDPQAPEMEKAITDMIKGMTPVGELPAEMQSKKFVHVYFNWRDGRPMAMSGPYFSKTDGSGN